MRSTYTGDPGDPDRDIYEALAERPNEAIRLRVQPAILRNATRGSNYNAWRLVRWTLECDSAAEAFAFRDALKSFFSALALLGPVAVRHGLEAMKTMQAAGEAGLRGAQAAFAEQQRGTRVDDPDRP